MSNLWSFQLAFGAMSGHESPRNSTFPPIFPRHLPRHEVWKWHWSWYVLLAAWGGARPLPAVKLGHQGLSVTAVVVWDVKYCKMEWSCPLPPRHLGIMMGPSVGKYQAKKAKFFFFGGRGLHGKHWVQWWRIHVRLDDCFKAWECCTFAVSLAEEMQIPIRNHNITIQIVGEKDWQYSPGKGLFILWADNVDYAWWFPFNFSVLGFFSIGNGTTLGGSRGLLDPPGNLASNNKDKRSSGMVPPVWSFLELISVLDYASVWLKPFCPAPWCNMHPNWTQGTTLSNTSSLQIQAQSKSWSLQLQLLFYLVNSVPNLTELFYSQLTTALFWSTESVQDHWIGPLTAFGRAPSCTYHLDIGILYILCALAAFDAGIYTSRVNVNIAMRYRNVKSLGRDVFLLFQGRWRVVKYW